MNRYGRGPTIGGPSKATATTQCQKCLKRGHYSYECKAVVQERPYVSRPSRTQQLLNPKLVPKLTSDVPQELLRKKGVADEQLAKAELERGRKRERQDDEGRDAQDNSKRMRSASSDSVSTFSTNMSQSPPRPPRDSARRRTRSRRRNGGEIHPSLQAQMYREIGWEVRLLQMEGQRTVALDDDIANKALLPVVGMRDMPAQAQTEQEEDTLTIGDCLAIYQKMPGKWPEITTNQRIILGIVKISVVKYQGKEA
ncbi:hypothetical protein PVAG01_03907 [Phlyctema vagabunda]|uniref:Uncharacterized protein n=1 Tax=Phlyctema vagabunda TaxID=108571 RepID=A0ABR4PNY0_9HELO